MTVDEHGRPEPPIAASEQETLIGFLEWQRSTLEWKTRDLDRDALGRTAASSTMTLGGLLKYIAWVEDHWFSHVLLGQHRAEVWASFDTEADPDGEWTSAAADSPEELRRIWGQSVEASRAALADALSRAGLDQVSVRPLCMGERPSLRWILVHMIEEYARHNGHADLIRESIDGLTGE